jgi:hypothetical protein
MVWGRRRGDGGGERSARNEVRLEDVVEQLDDIEGKLDEGVERSVKNESDIRWLQWWVRGVGVVAASSLAKVLLASLTS